MGVISFLATCGYVGHVKKAPGTAGSLLATILAYGLLPLLGFVAFAALTFALSILGIVVCTRYIQQNPESEDPKQVVIDELAGQWLCFVTVGVLVFFATGLMHALQEFIAIIENDPVFWLVGFALFRLFDIVKPWPVSWADRQVKGGLGIMLDDVIAGILAGVWLFAVISIYPLLFAASAELP